MGWKLNTMWLHMCAVCSPDHFTPVSWSSGRSHGSASCGSSSIRARVELASRITEPFSGVLLLSAGGARGSGRDSAKIYGNTRPACHGQWSRESEPYRCLRWGQPSRSRFPAGEAWSEKGTQRHHYRLRAGIFLQKKAIFREQCGNGETAYT